MAILNNQPFINTGLFDDINKTNNQISSMNIPQAPQAPQAPQIDPMIKRQRYGNMMLALSDVLKGRDPSQGVLQRQQMLAQQQAQAKQQKLIEDYKLKNPEMAGRLDLLMAGVPESMLGGKSQELFKGQGLVNQFYNVLLQGQQDESVRQSPMYKTAFNYLSQPKTETYINEFGQQVTKKEPGIISKEDYLPPVGVTAADEKPVVTEPKEEEVVKVSPERRKDLINNIDTLQNSLVKLTNFEEAVDELQPGIFTIGEERAKIQSLHTSILLELKNLEELGVLAGPDLDLLLGLLGDPTSFQQQFIKGGIAGTKVQIENIKNIINEKKQRFSKELGLKQPEGTITRTKEIAYMPNGRKIEVNATGDGWVYSDTGQAVEQ